MSLRDSLGGLFHKSSSTKPDRHRREPGFSSDSENIQGIRLSNLVEQHEEHFGSTSSGPHLSPIPSATRLNTSFGDTLSNSEHPKSQVTRDSVSLAEPEETHGFLRKDHSVAGPRNHGVIITKNYRFSLLSTWWTETTSLAIATAAFIAIMVTLVEYNGKEQPAWKYAINLNTLIAILSTLLRACMVFVTEEAISQLKWMLFRQPKPLRHLTHFDTAAHGPWGSLSLLFRIRTFNPALIGCIVIVLSVGIGPFTQQAVKSVPCNQPSASAEASIKIARYMHGYNITRIGAPDWDMDLSTKVAILDGLISSNTTQFALTPDCSTGNCTFPSYNGISHSSIGMCRKCVDVTPWLVEEKVAIKLKNGTESDNPLVKIVLPDGSSVGNSTGGHPPVKIETVTGYNTIWKSNHPMYDGLWERWNGSFLAAFGDEFRDVFTSSILNISLVMFTDSGCEYFDGDGRPSQKCSNNGVPTSYYGYNSSMYNVVATSCSFYPCVRDYHGSVQDARFKETIIAETPVLQPPGQDNQSFPNFERFHTPCQIDGNAYTAENVSLIPKDNHNFTLTMVGDEQISVPTQCVFGMYGVYALSLGDFMSETMFGDCIVPSRISFGMKTEDYVALMCDPWYIKGLAAQGNATFATLDANMQSVALAITSEIRNQGSDFDSLMWQSPTSQPPLYAQGTVIRTTVCTRFDWKWLAFPVALLASTMLLLCITCGKMLLDRQRIPAWKSSNLPLLFTGNQIGRNVAAGDLDRILADTDEMIVRLSHDGKGWEFVSEYSSHQEGTK